MKLRLTVILTVMLVCTVFSTVLADDAGSDTDVIDISASVIEYYTNMNIVTASGNLVIRYKDYVFTADEMEYREDEGIARFQGNVIVLYGEESKICADEIMLYIREEMLIATSEGEERVYVKTAEIQAYAVKLEYGMETGKLVMEENVNVVSGDISAECEKLEATEDLLVLSGNPIVYQNARRFSADEIFVYVEEKRIVARGNSRVLIE